MTKERIKWIDIAKGIGIILVVLGHAPRDIMREKYEVIDFMYTFIYSFHMALFFFISGITYSLSKKDNQFFKKKAKELLIPWINYSLTIYCLFIIANLIPFLRNIFKNSSMEIVSIKEYIKMMFTTENPYAFHTWYLLVLFIIEGVIYIYQRLVKNNINNVYLIPIILLAVVTKIFFKIEMPVIKFVIENLFYFSLGIIYGKKNYNIEHNNKIFSIIGIIFTTVYTLVRIKIIYFNEGILKIINILQFVIGTPLMILFIINTSKKISENRKLQYIGKNSYNIYLLHQPFFCALLGMLLVKILPMGMSYYIFTMLICIITSIACPILLVKIIYKSKINVIMKKIYNIQYQEYDYVKETNR